MEFYCDTCREIVLPQEGTLSWTDEGNTLSGFKITHKIHQNHNCDPKHVAYIHLWILTGISGFIKFTELLTDHWEKGYALKDSDKLKIALNQIGVYIWNMSKKD